MAGETTNPVLQVLRTSPSYALWLKISIPLGLLGGIALIVSGAGLLRFKAWGRKLTISYSIYALVVGLVTAVCNYLFLIQPLLEKLNHIAEPAAAAAVFGAIGGSVGGLLELIYPIVLLILMYRPRVIAAFAPPLQPPELAAL